MPILDKARISVGAHGHCKLDLSHPHLTTTNFMQLQPVDYRHMIPGEKIIVNASAFARLAPLAVPTYGRCRLNLRAFFVPFRVVMPKFTEFIEDTVSQKYNRINTPTTGIVTSTPIIKNSAFVELFQQPYLAVDASQAEIDADLYDFSFINQQSTLVYRKFTAKGRKFFKIFRSLGYQIIWNLSDNTVYSALAFLSYLRVYVDWYSLSAYQDNEAYQLFLSWFTYDNPNSPLDIDYAGLATAMQTLSNVCYDGDYFTSAWDNPVSPNSGLFTQFVVNDITAPDPLRLTSQVSQRSQNGTPIVQGLSSAGASQAGSVYMSQYIDDALKALTDYMKRHQLTGARAIDRYLADWGFNLPADKLQRSSYLGMSSIDINIGDVMSTANTAGSSVSNLGDYAGQGYLKGSKTFEFATSEFGLFVICSSVLPYAGIYQGYDRNNLHVTKDQFFLPDFDSLGVQSLAKGEVYVSKNGSFASAGDYDYTFGYTPRYAEYKVPRTFVTGDFDVVSALAGGDAWHLMRKFDDSYFNDTVANLHHNIEFCRGDVDAEQYNRIFNNTKDDNDKIYVAYQFDTVVHAPCKSLFDTYEFENHNKEVTLDSNGVKMN